MSSVEDIRTTIPLGKMTLEGVRRLVGSQHWLSVPLMDKERLRARTYSPDDLHDTLHWFSSSGTTSPPVTYPWTKRDEEVVARTLSKIHTDLMCPSGSPAFIIAPVGLPSMWAHMDRQLRFMGFATVLPGVDSQRRLATLIQYLRPHLLMSLPLALSRLGEIQHLLGITNREGPKLLFTGGDVLSNARRGRLERMWSAKLHNFYGLSEVFGPVASEDGHGTLIWRAEEVFVEVLDPSTHLPVDVGGMGVAVCTTLWDRPNCLVRYVTGDIFQLLGWVGLGQPKFLVKGRDRMKMPGLRSGFYPVDIDEVLLSDPGVGNEWDITCRTDTAVLRIEGLSTAKRVSPDTISRLNNLFEQPLRLEVLAAGSLPRTAMKLGMFEHHADQEE